MKIIIIIALCVFSVGATGQSIVYNGAKCFIKTSVNELTITKTAIPIQSKIEVKHSTGNGVFSLALYGGMPVLTEPDEGVCIKDSAFGSGNKPPNNAPGTLDSILATGIFDGEQLTIVYNTVDILGEARVTLTEASSSIFLIYMQRYVFDYNKERNSFTLTHIGEENTNWISSEGDIVSPFEVRESILTSDGLYFSYAPSETVEYFFE